VSISLRRKEFHESTFGQRRVRWTSISKNIATGRIGFRACSIERQPDLLPSHKVEGQSRKIQEREATIMQLEKRLKTLVARPEEQAAQIQKLSAQFEARKSSPKIVLNNQ
jgi:hypothetical protein